MRFAISVVVLSLAAGCGGPSDPKTPATTAAPAKRPLDGATCDAVIDHLVTVMRVEFEGAMKNCSAEKAAAMRKALVKGLDDARTEGVAGCKKEASEGKKIDPREYECFSAGQSIAAWKSCKFSSEGSFDKFDEDLDGAVKTIRDACEGKAPPADPGAK